MSWETKFRKALKGAHPNIRKITDTFTPEDMREVSRVARRDWEWVPGDPGGWPLPKTLREAVELAIIHVEAVKQGIK